MFSIRKIPKVVVVFSRRTFIAFLAYLLLGSSSEANEEREKSPDILLIFSSGTPYKDIRHFGAGEIDAITMATPTKENCRTIAEKIGSLLRERKLIVRLIEATEVKHRNEILAARLVVIGSPSHFGNVSWEIKKVLDEQFWKIYLLRERLNKKRIAGFAMAEIKPSADRALKAIEIAVNDCRGRFGPTAIFLTDHSSEEISQRIKKFADQLASLVSEK